MLWHTINDILNGLLPHKEQYKEPALVKKLLNGNGSSKVQKIHLGWVVNTILKMLELLRHCQEHLLSIFGCLWECKHISINWWLHIMGKLWLMALMLPGSGSLFWFYSSAFVML
jgi:hypothetical protein